MRLKIVSEEFLTISTLEYRVGSFLGIGIWRRVGDRVELGSNVQLQQIVLSIQATRRKNKLERRASLTQIAEKLCKTATP